MIYDLGLGPNIKVSSFIIDGRWNFNRRTTTQLMVISDLIDICSLPNKELNDEIVWIASEDGNFSSKTALTASNQSVVSEVWEEKNLV